VMHILWKDARYYRERRKLIEASIRCRYTSV